VSKYYLLGILLISTISFSNELIVDYFQMVGQWECDEIKIKNELFSMVSISKSELKETGEYIVSVSNFYDYFTKGTMDVTLIIKGTWSLNNNTLVIKNDSVKVIHLDSKLIVEKPLSDSELKVVLEKGYPIEDDNISEIIGISEGKATFLDLKGGESNCYRKL